MDQDPRLELETKAAETPTPDEVRRRSVQDRAEGEARQPLGRGVSYWLTWPVTDPEAMPEWPNAARDAKLRDWWWRIPLLGAVVTTFVSRISTLPLKVEADDEDDAAYWQWVLTNADFGRGWKTCIGKFTLDLLTQDNGSFLEVIRPAKVRGAKGLMPVHRLGPNSYAFRTPDGDYVKLGKLSLKAVNDDPWDTPIGLAHLDSGKCSRRLDPETPVVYNSRKGPRPLKFYQVFDASWMTSSREDDANYGMCPVTLCQIAARITKNIDVYVDEKVGGRYFKRIIWATNVFQEDLEQAIKDAEAQADARGQTRYVTNVVVGAADVTSPGEVGVLDLTGLPDGFDRETEYDIAADLITGCFGLDRPEVIPMRTATLGQAGQVGVMALKAKGKGVAEVIALVERFLSNWVLPQDGSVQASLDFKDDEEDARHATVQKDKSATVASLCSASTAEGVPPYTRAEVRALHEYYELIPEKMLTPEEAAETPGREENGCRI